MSLHDYTPEEIMQAHQYLYYVGPSTIWTDYEYDYFCKKHDLNGCGGSDLESSYSDKVATLAKFMHASPSDYPPEKP